MILKYKTLWNKFNEGNKTFNLLHIRRKNFQIRVHIQRLSPDIRITRNPDLPAHFGTRIPDTPNPGKRMSDEHYFKAFFGSFLQRNGRYQLSEFYVASI